MISPTLFLLLPIILSQLHAAALNNDYKQAVSFYKTAEAIENIIDPKNALVTPDHFFPIFWCESRLLHKVGNKVTRSKTNDVGVGQINEKIWLPKADSHDLNIYEKNDNIRFAYRLWLEYKLKPWSASEKCWSKLLHVQIAQK